LINEAVEAPLQFPKSRKIIFQLRKPSFDREEVLFTGFEGSATGRRVIAVVDMFDEEYC
jgi:hypothetical protein